MVVSPGVLLSLKVFKTKGLPSDFDADPGLNAKARLVAGPFFCSVSIIASGGKLLRTELLFVCMRLRRLGLDKVFGGEPEQLGWHGDPRDRASARLPTLGA